MDPNPFERDRRQTRKRVVAALGAAAALVVVVLGLMTYFDADRLLAKEKPALDATRARLCAILEGERRGGERQPVSPGKPVKILGWFALDSNKISRSDPAGNMDKMELEELESICAGGRLTRGRVLTSIFGELVEPDPRRRSGYEYAAVKHALEAMKRLEFVLVLKVDRYVESVSIGPGTMAPGRYSGRATLYRVSDGAYLDSVALDQNAPGVATVFGRRSASGGVLQGDVDSSLAASTSLAFEDAIARAFGERGITLTMY